MNDYKIWVTYHKDEQVSRYGLKGDSNHEIFASHHKPRGKNINVLNPAYSEMVTMWYVWKNKKKSSCVGFNHYRRQFDVRRLPSDGECQVYKIMDFGKKTIYRQYAEFHNVKDMDTMLSILDEKYGKCNPYSRHITESNRLIGKCCFLMRWEYFLALCEFLFPLIESFREVATESQHTEKATKGRKVELERELEAWRLKAELDFGGKDTVYQTRTVSFLAERLISAWISVHTSYYIGGRDVAIVHYNTPELTEAAIRSLNRVTPGCRVFVFDNSDTRAFTTDKIGGHTVTVIDNTKGQLVDFEKELEKYADRDKSDVRKSNFGSAKHSMSVDKLMELLPDGFVLMDSDVLLKQDISSLWDRNVAASGHQQIKNNVPLLQPFLCWLNVPMLREKGIHYFNGEKMWALTTKKPNCYYDTGAYVLEAIRENGLEVKFVNIWEHVIHFGHGSWRGSSEKVRIWLDDNYKLWE